MRGKITKGRRERWWTSVTERRGRKGKTGTKKEG